MRFDPTSPTARFMIARALVSRPGGTSVAELMERLGASRATVMRYLRDLPVSGTPVDSEWRGSHKVYMVPQRARVGGGREPFDVEPYTLLFHRKQVYVMGPSLHPPHGGSIRRFAFDGIRSLAWRRGERFAYPAKYRPEAELRSAFGIVTGPAESIRVPFDAAVARSVTRRRWHRSQKVTTLPSGDVELELRCAPSFEVKTWILGWGRSAEVIAPAALRADVAREIAAMAATHAEC